MHLVRHDTMCMIPGCNPRLCFGGIASKMPVPVHTGTERSNSDPSAVSTLSVASHSNPPGPLAAVSPGRYDAKHCYICNTSLRSKNALQMVSKKGRIKSFSRLTASPAHADVDEPSAATRNNVSHAALRSYKVLWSFCAYQVRRRGNQALCNK